MTHTFDHLPADIARPLIRFRDRRRLLHVLRTLALLAAAYLVLLLGATHLDRFAFLETGTRQAITWGVHLALVLAVAAFALRFLLRRDGGARIAYELEARLGAAAVERFVTAEALYRHGDAAGDPTLVAQLRRETEALGRELDGAALVRDRSLVRRCWGLGGLVVLCGLLWALPGYDFGLMVERFLFPGRNLPKPSFVALEVEPREAVVGRGGEVVIQVSVEGRIPAWLAPILEWTGADSGRCLLALAEGDEEPRFDRGEPVSMSRIQRDLFLATRDGLERDFAFRVRCGDAQTATHRVRVVAQPVIDDPLLVVEHPAYTGLGREEITALDDPVSLLPGTRAELRFTVDQADVEVRLLHADGEEPIALERGQDGLVRHAFEVTEATLFEPRATNAAGFDNVDRLRIRIGLREDLQPTVRLAALGQVLELLPGELVPIQLAAEDDFGLATAAVQYRINPHLDDDAPLEEEVFAEFDGGLSAEVGGSFDLGNLAVAPGDEVVLQLRVRDSAGNDGLSRPVLVRVVALTRGEYEQRRIEALSLAARGIAVLRQRDGRVELPVQIGSELVEAAAVAGFGLPAPGDLPALITLLEREHHLSEGAEAKRDLRALTGILRRIEEQPETFETLMARTQALVPILRYRRMRNATWRLYGMQAEALRIRDVLTGLVAEAEDEAEPEPEEESRRAMHRRTALYLDVLQDVGDEILAAAEVVPDFDPEAVKAIQGELNTAAYYLKRGSLAKNLASADEVLGHLERMIALVVPNLPPLAAEAIRARTGLAADHRARAVTVAAQRDAAARDWFAGELRALDREPVAALWPRIEAWHAAEALRAGRSVDLAALRATAEAAIEADRRHTAVLRLHTGLAALRRDLPDGPERRLALALAQLEYHLAPGGDAAQAERLAAAIAEGSMLEPPVPPPLRDAEEDPAASMAALDLVDEPVLVTDAATGIVAAAAERALATADAAEGGTLPGDRELRTIEDDLAVVGLALDNVARAIALRLTDLAPRAEESPSDEVLLLKLRRSLDRFHARSARARAGLTTLGGDAQGAGQAQEAAIAARGLGQALDALAGQVAGHAADHRAGRFRDEEERARLPRLERHAETDRLLLVADAVGATGSSELVSGLFAAMPEAAARYLASEGDRLATAAEALAAAVGALDAQAPDGDVYEVARQRALDAVAAFARAVERCGSPDLQESWRPGIEALEARLRRLRLADDAGEEHQRLALYGLDEAQRELERLRRRLSALSQAEGLAPGEWRGGPEGLWDGDALRRDAERRRSQLAALADLCEERAVLGVVAALDGAGDPAAVVWARTLHRMVRSPLAGQAAERTGGGDEEGGDSLHRWLAGEARTGLKRDDLRTYPVVSRRYLESLLDLLRY